MFRFLSSSFQHQGWVSQILISDIKWMSERYIWWVKSDWHFSVKFRQEWPHRGRRWIIMMERCICMWKPCRAALTEGFSCEKGWPRLPVTMFTTRRKQHCPFDICRYISWVATYLHICIYKGSFMWKGLTKTKTKTKTNQRCQWPQSPTGTGRNCETIQRVGVD